MKSFALILTLALVPVAAQQTSTVVTPACSYGSNVDGTCKPAPGEPAEPTLSTEQKLALQNMALTLENLQLKAQQVAAEHQRVSAQMQQMITAITPAGYQLTADPEKGLVFVKVPPPAAKKD